MGRRRSGGGAGFKLLVLLALVLGFGGWNYRRNVAAEAAEHRPYRSYSPPDLAALIEAYQGEIDGYRRRYEAATGAKIAIRDGGPIGEKIREFERVQQISRTTREIGARLAEREAAVGHLERELERKALERDRVVAFLKRAFVYRPTSS